MAAGSPQSLGVCPVLSARGRTRLLDDFSFQETKTGQDVAFLIIKSLFLCVCVCVLYVYFTNEQLKIGDEKTCILFIHIYCIIFTEILD